MSPLKWETPPPTNCGRGSTKWDEVVAALKERPGEWALALEDVSVANATHLKRKYPGVETTVRGSHKVEGTSTVYGNVYARFVGAS